MKCDDDTFIRVDAVLNEIRGVAYKRSLYMGNLNLLHRPLRSGKWAVTYEVICLHGFCGVMTLFSMLILFLE